MSPELFCFSLHPCLHYIQEFALKLVDTKQQHVYLFFQSHQDHYLTLTLMKSVLMSPLRFVFAHLFIHQVEAAASSAVQQSTACCAASVLYYKSLFPITKCQI